MQFDGCSLRVVDRNSEIQVLRRLLQTVRDIDFASEDSGGIVSLPIHVVPQNVPLLVGADILDAQQRYIRKVTDELVSTAGWTLTIARC
jgi:hypothetical protein